MTRILVFILFSFSLSLHASVYKWVDENGKVHFTDKKPNNKNVEEKHYKNTAPAPDPETQNHKKSMAEYMKMKQQQERDAVKYKKQQLARAQKKSKICKNLLKYKNATKNAALVYTFDENGHRIIYNKEQRQAAQKRANHKYAKYCK
ncbi:MAG: DUF4124 domain-containing protein [Pseudomonadales bacterium]|nr:DUF4124 domain-containing protein [Pseudomonadales bacterium]